MNWWSALPEYWRGFIAGGVAIPLTIVVVECIVKYALYGKVFGK